MLVRWPLDAQAKVLMGGIGFDAEGRGGVQRYARSGRSGDCGIEFECAARLQLPGGGECAERAAGLYAAALVRDDDETGAAGGN